MRSGVIAQKVGMTRVFTETGEHIPVTVLKLGNCQVLGHRTSDKNGYVALQLGARFEQRAQAAVTVDRHPPRVERARDDAERRQLRLQVRMAAAAEAQADLPGRVLGDRDVAAMRDVGDRGHRQRRLLVAADAAPHLRRGGQP